MKAGDKVSFKTTEKVKQGRRKVEQETTAEGTIERVYAINGKDYADVTVAQHGGLSITAVKRLEELKAARFLFVKTDGTEYLKVTTEPLTTGTQYGFLSTTDKAEATVFTTDPGFAEFLTDWRRLPLE